MSVDHILFICVANSARSQMAEALARQKFGDRVRVQSAGSRPGGVNPYALRVLAEVGIDASRQVSKHVDTIDPASVDLVVTLCAEEECPLFLGKATRLNWAMPDPDRKGEDLSDEERLGHFREARHTISKRLVELADFMRETEVIAATRAWLEGVVLHYNLCPFAHTPARNGRIRYSVCAGAERNSILAALLQEMNFLLSDEGSDVDTSLLILPDAFPDFLGFNAFLNKVDSLLRKHDLEGTFQVVSFHPQYVFADSEPDDFSAYTNRSPFPMLHILREEQVSAAVDSHRDVEVIPGRNIDLLRALSDSEKERVRELSRCPPLPGEGGMC